MSRIGLMPVKISSEVKVTEQAGVVDVVGPKGKVSVTLPHGIKIRNGDTEIIVVNELKENKGKALHGLVRAQLANAVNGVTAGWSKTLELVGVGYRASLSGTDLTLTVGFSHPVIIKSPEGISFSIQEGKIIVAGIDKQRVGQVAADIRAVKKPEPYKGKGIRYQGEYVRKKAGKAKSVGGAAK